MSENRDPMVDGVQDRTASPDQESLEAVADAEAPPVDAEQALRQEYEAAISGLHEQLRERDRKLREYIEAHQIAVREMEQARGRLERDREVELDRHRAVLAGSILEVVDDLDRTLEGASRTRNLQAVLEGTELVRARIVGKLEELGVESLDSLGQPFDPNLHEAVALVPIQDATQDQRVLAVELPGYLFRGKLLRAARVVVGTLAEG